MGQLFARVARTISNSMGTPLAFTLAVLVIVVWAVTGPIFGFSDTWQLVINTGTTIITFLMVFLIQNSQNRDSLATQLKLDELIRAVERANDSVINIEEGTEKQLHTLQQRFRKKAEKAIDDGDPDSAEANDDAADAVDTVEATRGNTPAHSPP